MTRTKPTSQLPTNPHSQTRPTIAYFTANLEVICQPVWCGAMDAAQEQDVNLICFAGANLRDPGFWTQSNIIYDLVTPENVDGLITWASMMGTYVTLDELESFHRHYHPLPVVTMGRPLENSHTLLVENVKGMGEAVRHLIEAHGYRRLAFIRGPEEHVYAQGRYQAYVDTLKAYDIPFEPNLVTPAAPWGRETGEEAVRLLLDERGLRPQVDLDAIVVVSEDVTMGAAKALQARGVKIPYDLAIVGFDDTVLSQTHTPPLTMVAASFYEIGRQTVETVLALRSGEQVPREATVPSKLMIRQSCGCALSAVANVIANPRETGDETLEEALATRRPEILAAMAQTVGDEANHLAEDWADRLLTSCAAELSNGSSDVFLRELDDLLRQAIASDSEVSKWQEAISALRQQIMPYLKTDDLCQAVDLWEQARVTIGEAAQRQKAYQNLQTEQYAEFRRQIAAALITTFDVVGLMDVLAERLPELGFPSCYLALYENPQPYAYLQPAPEWSRLMLAYTDQGRIALEPEGRRFQSHEILPEDVLPAGRQFNLVIEPLYFQDHQLGFIAFEAGPREGAIYAALCTEISSALQGALLLRAQKEAEATLEQAYMKVEQQVQQRTAELERETIERERAQAESLRLQQEIIETQQRAIKELSTPVIPVWAGVIIVPLIGSIDSLRARDITRALLAGISQHRAGVVIIDVTGVPLVDSGVAGHLHKTIQAARLKGTRTIVTGITAAVAETIVDLGVDWSHFETMSDLQTGLRAALTGMQAQKETR